MFSPWVVGCDGDAEVDRAAGQRERDAAVLRRARLGDVHLRHDLDAHRHRRPVGLVQAADLAQHAVDAVADAQEVLLGLEVDVGGAALHRVGEQRVDQAHHRLRVLVAARLQALVVDLAGLDLVQDAVDRELVAVELLDRALRSPTRPRGAARSRSSPAELRAQLVERDDVVGVGDRDDEALALPVSSATGNMWCRSRQVARHDLGSPPGRRRCATGRPTAGRASRTARRAASPRRRSRAAPAACPTGLAGFQSARAARCAAGPR